MAAFVVRTLPLQTSRRFREQNPAIIITPMLEKREKKDLQMFQINLLLDSIIYNHYHDSYCHHHQHNTLEKHWLTLLTREAACTACDSAANTIANRRRLTSNFILLKPWLVDVTTSEMKLLTICSQYLTLYIFVTL